MTPTLERQIDLHCPPAHAFRVFVENVDLWWPRGHRRGRDSRLRFDAGPQGRLVDVAADGSEWTMARVTAMDAPHRLAFDWFPGSPDAPTHVEIAFEPVGHGTRVRIVHKAVAAASVAIWADRVGRFAAGWEAVLDALRAATARGEDS